MANLRTFGSSITLTDYKGEHLALMYLGADVDVDTRFGKQTAARASVVHFQEVDDVVVAKRLGSTLVFQRAIANALRESADWQVGILEELPRPTESAPDATMYTLSDPLIDISDLGEAMDKANIE